MIILQIIDPWKSNDTNSFKQWGGFFCWSGDILSSYTNEGLTGSATPHTLVRLDGGGWRHDVDWLILFADNISYRIQNVDRRNTHGSIKKHWWNASSHSYHIGWRWLHRGLRIWRNTSGGGFSFLYFILHIMYYVVFSFDNPPSVIHNSPVRWRFLIICRIAPLLLALLPLLVWRSTAQPALLDVKIDIFGEMFAFFCRDTSYDIIFLFRTVSAM